MTLSKTLYPLLLAGAVLPAAAADETGRIAVLERQVQDLRDAQAGAVKVTIANGRPTIAAADGSFSISLRATVQYDTGFYFQDDAVTAGLTPAFGRDLSNGTNFRRAQFGVDGTLFKDWRYALIFDFGGSGTEEAGRISQAWLQYDGAGPFQLRLGAFAPYLGLEDSTSAANVLFPERSTPSELSRSSTGGDGRTGVQLAAVGESYLVAFSYTGAKVTDAAVFDEQQAVNARLAYLFYSDKDTKLVGSLTGVYEFDAPDSTAGAAGATTISLSDRPELRVDGTKLIGAKIDAQSLLIGGVEAGAVWKNLYAQGGWFTYHIQRRAGALPDPDFSGWYMQASWVLTGESKPYDPGRAAFRNPKPADQLGFGRRGIGAWELATRYSVTDLDFRPSDAPSAGGVWGGRQKILTAGLNWYPNNAVKFMFDYYHVDIDRLNASAVAASAPYPAIAAGADIGQRYNAFNIRAQIAF